MKADLQGREASNSWTAMHDVGRHIVLRHAASLQLTPWNGCEYWEYLQILAGAEVPLGHL